MYKNPREILSEIKTKYMTIEIQIFVRAILGEVKNVTLFKCLL